MYTNVVGDAEVLDLFEAQLVKVRFVGCEDFEVKD